MANRFSQRGKTIAGSRWFGSGVFVLDRRSHRSFRSITGEGACSRSASNQSKRDGIGTASQSSKSRGRCTGIYEEFLKSPRRGQISKRSVAGQNAANCLVGNSSAEDCRLTAWCCRGECNRLQTQSVTRAIRPDEHRKVARRQQTHQLAARIHPD